MDILFYSTSLAGIGKSLLRIAASHVPRERIDLCRSLGEFDCRLRQPLEGCAIAILHAGDREELEAMVARRELLADFRVILVLPDNDEAATSLGHVLKPRFMVFSDGDLPDASVILGKMLLPRRNPPRPAAENRG
jgi:hypothetical protein